MSLGLYIHIPFCRSICAYCDFFRGVYDREKAEKYPAAQECDARDISKSYGINSSADSVYIGGGTPTVLPNGVLERALIMIKKHIFVEEGAEFTCEGNPESFTEEKARELKGVGVNRVSLGVQSLCDKTLAALGRAHDSYQAKAAVERAVKHGFRVSADIMLGVPFQTEADVREFARTMRSLGAEHLSAYMLTVHKGTQLDDMVKRGEFTPDDDFSADLYYAFDNAAREQGYGRYEVSNWALAGAECRHNIKYWTGGDYVGLGAGAYSKIGLRRFHTAEDTDAYISGNIARITDEEMTESSLALEKVVFGLRTRMGAGAEVLTAAGIDREKLLATPYFTFENNALHIKDEYLLTSDGIIVKYIL